MTLYGYDMSSYQTGLDPAAVPGDFVIIKATGGTAYVNPDCDRAYQAAKAAGKLLGVYHYVHEASCPGTPEQEARWFLANTKGYAGEAIFFVDWESDNVADSAYALEFKRVIETEGGLRPAYYGSTSQLGFVKPCFDADSAIWAAGYTLGYQRIDGYNPPQGPIGVPAGMAVSMWQFTSTGYLPGWGGALDLNVFYGDADAWRKLAAPLAGSAPAPAPAPVAAPAPAPVAAPAPAAAPSQCIVEAGDTLGGIAAQFGVTLAAIEAANPGINYDLIHPGQVLNLPGSSAPAPVPAPTAAPSQCIVEAGDTLSGIAAQFGVTLAAVIAANPGINPDLIYPGQVLNL